MSKSWEKMVKTLKFVLQKQNKEELISNNKTIKTNSNVLTWDHCIVIFASFYDNNTKVVVWCFIEMSTKSQQECSNFCLCFIFACCMALYLFVCVENPEIWAKDSQNKHENLSLGIKIFVSFLWKSHYI